MAEEILAETQGLRVEYAPFVFWRLAPNQSGRHFAIDARGFRGRGSVCGDGSLRVLLLGGSQAWGVGASSDRATIGGHMAELLGQEGSGACVVNAAQPGYVLRQVRIQLFDDLLREPWDVVVVMSGFNDVLAALQNGAAGDVQNSYRFREAFSNQAGVGATAQALVRELLSSSRLLERLGAPRPRLKARPLRASPRTDSVESLRPLLADMARQLAEDARTIAAVCRERGAAVILVLEPCLPVDKPASPAETVALDRLGRAFPLYVPSVRLAYAQLREALAAAARSGFDFVDASRVFEQERTDVYIDEIHLTDPGNRAVAELLAQRTRLRLRGEAR